MNKKFFLALLFFLTIQSVFSQHAIDSTHSAKATAEILLEQRLSKNDLKNNMVRMEIVVFPPGYSSTQHIHPCPLFVYVLEGELLSEFEGKKNVYKAGDTFYEKATGLHSITKNNSATQQVKILVVYLMKEGMETFIPMKH
jgi:quercetin dioxygenase-like cupin family protein